MPKLASNVWDMKTKTLFLKGEEAPKGYKGKNLVKKVAKKEETE